MEDRVATGLPGSLSAESWADALSVILEAIAALLVAEGLRFELVACFERRVVDVTAVVWIDESVCWCLNVIISTSGSGVDLVMWSEATAGLRCW